MADKIINLKINVLAIDQSKLFVGEKGTYLDATLLYNEATDQYGNNGVIVQQVSKEERAAGNKGAILGNGKVFVGTGGTQGADIAFPTANNGNAQITQPEEKKKVPF